VNVLVLGPRGERLVAFLKESGDSVRQTNDRLDVDDPLLAWADVIVSYGYRYIIPADILDRFRSRAINLHISLLPWNRGADPNVWSFLEDTPAGVTVHLMDEGVDTGDVLAQRAVEHDRQNDTLRTSYDRLASAIEELFMGTWPKIREGSVAPVPQPVGGSEHRSADLQPYSHLLVEGWDTPVRDLIGRAR